MQQVGTEFGECNTFARKMQNVEFDVIFFGTLSA
jgi:hypothetical protein